MAKTASMTLIALAPTATVFVGDRPLFIQAKPLGADGLSSGSPVSLSSGNLGIGKVTTEEQLGNAPAGVIGVAPGSVTITATAVDNTAVTATLVVTVS